MSGSEPDTGPSIPPDDPAPDFVSVPFALSPARDPVPRDDVFWGWHDVFLFIFIMLLALASAAVAAPGIRHVLHLSETHMNIVFVAWQFVAYGVAFTCLKLMFRAEYGEPLLGSLHWLPSRLPPGTLALIGLGQAFIIALAGAFMSVPQTDNAMTRLMSDRPTSILLAVLGVTIAPLAEELAFRGLLQPLMIRMIGAVPGILGTALLFGLMHLAQYGSWQSVLLVGFAGAGFGAMRHWTGSTRASAIMHAGYNSALFIVFFTQKGSQH